MNCNTTHYRANSSSVPGDPTQGTYIGVNLSETAGTSQDPYLQITYTIPDLNQPPTVATPAAAMPSPVAGTTTNLSVLGADDGGEGNLTYTWAATGTPPAPVSFSANGNNAAKNTVATFSKAGAYNLQATIADAGGLSTTSSVSVTVDQTLTSIAVSPPSPTVTINTTQPFMATGRDQFGNALSAQPVFTWSVNGGGTINSAGLFSAGSSAGGPFTVTAATGGLSGTSSVTVGTHFNAAPIVNAGSGQKIFDSTASVTLSGTASDPDGDALTYAWTKVSGPGTVTFSAPNSLSTVATFSGAGALGNYILRLTASDGSLTQSSDVVITYAPSATNLLGYWPLDSISSDNATPDLSSNNLSSLTYNNVVVPGHAGNGLSFNGTNSAVRLGGNALNLNNNSFTIALWTDQLNAANGTYKIVRGFGGGAPLAQGWGIQGSRFVLSDGTGGINHSMNVSFSSARPNGTWVHLAAVVDNPSRTVTLYEDGVQVASAAIPATLDLGNIDCVQANGQSQYDVGLGARVAAGSSTGIVPWYSGKLDEVLIYNRALSSADVGKLATVPNYNQPPGVSAGRDDSILLGGTVNLSGSASDDGLGGPLSTSWSQVSGPGTVTFANASALATTATFSAAGLYRLRLTASDTASSTSSDVLINVLPAGNTPVQSAPFQITDYYGVAFPDQLVTFKLPSPIDARNFGSYFMVQGATQVPFQFATPDPVTHLATAVYVRVPSLAAFGSISWRMYQGTPPSTPTYADQVTPTVDANYFVALTNGKTGVRIQQQLTDAQLAALANVPAAIQGLLMHDSTWTGNGNIISESRQNDGGGHKPALNSNAMTIRYLDGDPVNGGGALRTTIQVSYSVSVPAFIYGSTTIPANPNGYITERITLEAGQPSILIEDDSNDDFNSYINLYAGVPIDQSRYRGHVNSSGNYLNGYEYGTTTPYNNPNHDHDAFVDYVPTTNYHVDYVTNIPAGYQQFQAVWDPWAANSGWYNQYYDKDAPNTANMVGTFAGPISRALSSGLNGVGFYGQLSSGNVGIEYTTKRRNAANGYPTAALGYETRVAWGLFVGSKADMSATGAGVETVGLQMNTHSGINLNAVKDVNPTFPDPAGGWQGLWLPTATLNRMANQVHNDSAYYAKLLGADASDTDIINMWRDGTALGTQPVVRNAVSQATSLLNSWVNGYGTYTPGAEYWGGADAMVNGMNRLDTLLINPNTSAVDKATAKAILALYGGVLFDNDFVPADIPYGFNFGTANMPVQYAADRNQFGLFLQSNPAIASNPVTSLANLETYVKNQFEAIVSASGAEIGGTHYQLASLEPVVSFMQELKVNNAYSLYATEIDRILNLISFELNFLTPPDPRFANSPRRLPAIGDGNTDGSEIYGILASLFSDENPTLSRQLMWAWLNSGSTQSTQFGPSLFKIDDALPSQTPALGNATFSPDGPSGWYSVLRNGFGTSNETATWFVNGRWYADHANNDLGEIINYSLGKPLSLDWGGFYTPQDVSAYYHSMVVETSTIPAGYSWNSDSIPAGPANTPGVDNYTRPTASNENFASFTNSGRSSATFAFGPNAFTGGYNWLRAVQSIHPVAPMPITVIDDSFTGTDAAAAKVMSLNLMATVPTGSPTDATVNGVGYSITPRNDAGNNNTWASNGPVVALNPNFGVNEFAFTGQNNIDFSVFVLGPGATPYSALIGNWGVLDNFVNERQDILRVNGAGSFKTIVVPWVHGSKPAGLSVSSNTGSSTVTIATSTQGVTVIGPNYYSYTNTGESDLTTYDAGSVTSSGASPITIAGGPTEILVNTVAGTATVSVSGAAGMRTFTLPGATWTASGPITPISGNTFSWNYTGSGATTATLQVNQAPTVATPASATPNPVTGTTTNLSVLGADDGGEANLTYTWATTGTPPAPVTFTSNGTNAAKNTTASFTKPGVYNFQVTITDSGSLSTASSVSVTVNQAVSSITVSPAMATVSNSSTQPFSATAYDQFGRVFSTPPAFTWSVTGLGSINSTSGLYMAPASGAGPATVYASSGGVSGTATVTVTSGLRPLAWWKLDDGSGSTAHDATGNGHDGTLSGGTSWSANVPPGSTSTASLSLNGSGYVQVPTSGDFALGSSNFSVSLWAKWATVGQGILIGDDEGGGSTNKWMLGYNIPGQPAGLVFHINGAGVPMGGVDPIAYNWTPSAGQWYHLTVTRTGNAWQLFINDSLVQTQTYSLTIPTPNAPLTIGAAEQIAKFNGLLSDVRISGSQVSVTAPSGQTSLAGDSVTLPISATDYLGLPLSYSAANLPAGLSINASTGVISGTIAAGADMGSPYTVTVTASDGSNSGSATFAWTVNPVVVVQNGVIAWWKLDEGAGGTAQDSSGNGHDGTLVGGASWSGDVPPGSSGAASLALDGSGEVDVPAAANLALGNFFSISLWAKWQVVDQGILIGHDDGGGPTSKWMLGYNVPGQPSGLIFHINGPTVGMGAAPLAYDWSPNADQWYYLTVTRDGDTWQLFIDNALVETETFSVNMPTPAAPLTIGAAEQLNKFVGLLSDIRISGTMSVVTVTASNQTNQVGDQITLPISATDALGLPLTFSAVNLPDGLSIDPSTGVISGAIAAGADLGSPYTVTVTATDGSNSGSASFTWTVNSAVQSGLLAWWKLDEGSGSSVADSSGNGHNGSLSGGASWSGDVPPGSGNAASLALDGSGDVAAPGVVLGNSFTISLWAKWQSVAEGMLLGQDEGGGGSNKWILGYNIPGQPAGLIFHVNGPSVGGQAPIAYDWTPDTDTWHHLTVTRAGDTWQLFIDDSLVQTQTASFMMPRPQAPLTIGAAEQLKKFNGLLSDIQISAGTGPALRGFNAGQPASAGSGPAPGTTWTTTINTAPVTNTTTRAGSYEFQAVITQVGGQSVGSSSVTVQPLTPLTAAPPTPDPVPEENASAATTLLTDITAQVNAPDFGDSEFLK